LRAFHIPFQMLDPWLAGARKHGMWQPWWSTRSGFLDRHSLVMPRNLWSNRILNPRFPPPSSSSSSSPVYGKVQVLGQGDQCTGSGLKEGLKGTPFTWREGCPGQLLSMLGNCASPSSGLVLVRILFPHLMVWQRLCSPLFAVRTSFDRCIRWGSPSRISHSPLTSSFVILVHVVRATKILML